MLHATLPAARIAMCASHRVTVGIDSAGMMLEHNENK
jgi:hypothetical protein